MFNLTWNSNWEDWSDLSNLKLTVVLKLSSTWQNDKKQRYFNFQKISFVKIADKLITLVKIVCRNTAHICIVFVCTSKWTFFVERWSQIRFCIQGTKIKLKFDKSQHWKKIRWYFDHIYTSWKNLHSVWHASPECSPSDFQVLGIFKLLSLGEENNEK